MLKEKIKDAEALISRVLPRYHNPCIFWSGGKDSTVLLHIVKFLIGLESIPVICYREPWFPWKLQFINRLIFEWGLSVWDYAPSQIALCRGNGRIDVMQYYQINTPKAGQSPEYMIVARGTEKVTKEDEKNNVPFLCGLETFLSKPLGTFDFPWDLAFHGHKSIDDDPLSGKVPLKVDTMQNKHCVDAIFPLRNWSDDEIFEYHEKFNLPYDETRYNIKNREVLENDKHTNPDYYKACFACCDPENPEYVWCPKYKMEVNNISHQIPWVEPKADYCSLRVDEKG